MKRDSYSDQQSHASFQPRSPQTAIEPTQLGQPVHHSSSTGDLGAKWLNKASRWVADKFQTAQNFMGSGDAISPDQLLPALKGTAKPALSQTNSTPQPLVGVIDSGFGTDEHGSKMVEAIQQENPQAKIWQREGVGTGGGLESLVEFVDVAKATGQSRAVANLSFDLTEVHPDGSTSTRTQLTAEEQSALAYARDHGVLVVASAGNQGSTMSALGQASQPFDNLIVVGAANGSDRASYSSYGNGLDLVADVGTAGTSLAAAKVTGAIANIWSTNPGLNSQQVNQILTTTATDLKTPGRDAETGAGLLNSTGAIDLATHTTPEAIVFSGAQLVQQVADSDQALSFSSRAWTSTDGAIASERPNWNWSDVAHGVLDVAGFVPVVGAVADIANAGLYAAEGDYANAALSAAAAVPGIGDAAAAAKLANRGVQAVQAANRGTRPTQSAAPRAVPSRTLPSRPERPTAPEPIPPSRSRQPESARPPATSERQQPVPERSGSPGAAPRSGGGRVRKAVAATTAVATVASHVTPVVSEEAPRPNPIGSDPNPTPGQPTQPNRPPTEQHPNPTPTQPPSSPPMEQPNPTPGQITMRQGDTLWEIAQEQLGSGHRWTDLLKADGSPFTKQEASRLPIGTMVHLPTPTPLTPSLPQTPTPNTPISPSSTPTQLPSEQPNPTPGQITMRQGDTLWEIAQEQLGSGHRWTDLLKADGSSFTEQEASRLPVGTIVNLSKPAPLSPSLPQAPKPNTSISPSPTPPDSTPLEITYPKPVEVPISPGSTITAPVPLEITYPKPVEVPISPGSTITAPAPLEITYPKPLEVPISPGSTPTYLPWSSPLAKMPEVTLHIGGGNSPSVSNSEPNDQSKSLNTPTSIDASKLLPKKATSEDIAILQKFLDQHPELMPEEIRSEATTPFGKRKIWELLRAMGINPEALQIPNWRDTDQMRREPGVAVGGETLPDTDYLFQPLDNQGKQRAPIGLIPGQIARQLRGKHFEDFAEFRATFWKLVAEDPKLSQDRSKELERMLNAGEDPKRIQDWVENEERMLQGNAPLAPLDERRGGEITYQLDHSDDLQYGGGVYDIDSIRIVTPRFHDKYGK